MKSIHPAFKILTVLGFVALLSGFVAYRSGAFESTESTTAVDTPGVKKQDTVSIESFYIDEAMSSSKSGVVFEEETFVQDTTKKAQQKQQQKSATNANQSNTNKQVNANSYQTAPNAANQAPNNPPPKVIMGSSKSSGIFVPKSDTQKPKMIMGSSKSDKIFIPKADTGKKN